MDASSESNQEGLLNVINKQKSNTEVYSSKTIFLEEGDSRGGLVHIMQGHGNDFQTKLGAVGEQAVADKIHSIVLKGDFCTYGFQEDPRGGFSLCYQINESLYLIVVVSNKGFIVSSYPKDKASSSWNYKEKKGKKVKSKKK